MQGRSLARVGSVVALVLAAVMGVVLVAALGFTAEQRIAARPAPAASPSHELVPSPSPIPSPSPSPPPPLPPTPPPPPPPPPASPVGPPQIFVYIFGSDYGDLAASTLPGAVCTASVTMPDGNKKDLGKQTADAQGKVVWSYPPKSPAAQGNGVHSVSCRLGSQSASSDVNFEVGG